MLNTGGWHQKRPGKDLRIGVYAIENIAFKRVYVGSTRRSFDARWANHYYCLERGIHACLSLQLDWYISGAGWFKFVPLEEASGDGGLAHLEQAWIDRLTRDGFSCYNKVRAYEHRLRPTGEKYTSFSIKRELYTLQETACCLHVSTRTLRSWIQQGNIKAFKDGGAWRIRREEVSRLLKGPNHTDLPDAPYGEYE